MIHINEYTVEPLPVHSSITVNSDSDSYNIAWNWKCTNKVCNS